MANYNNYNSGLGWKILSLFLALIIVAGVITGVVFWQKGNIVFNPVEQEQPNDEEDDGGAVIEEGESNGIKLMSAKISPENYDEYGISPMAETAYQLTATVTPQEATEKAVDWSVAFVNPSSEWATGKTVTEYVTVTPTSDGALTANVECLQAFGEQIKVTVTSRSDESKTASCTVDYAQKLESTFVTFAANSNLSGDKAIVLNESNYSSEPNWFVFDMFLTAPSSDKKTPQLTYNTNEVYTLADEYTTTIEIVPSEELVKATPSVVKGSYDATNGFCPNQEFLNTIFGESFATDSQAVYRMAQFFSIYAVADAINVIVTTTGTYSESVVTTFSIAFSADSVGVAVSDITLNNSAIVF